MRYGKSLVIICGKLYIINIFEMTYVCIVYGSFAFRRRISIQLKYLPDIKSGTIGGGGSVLFPRWNGGRKSTINPNQQSLNLIYQNRIMYINIYIYYIYNDAVRLCSWHYFSHIKIEFCHMLTLHISFLRYISDVCGALFHETKFWW